MIARPPRLAAAAAAALALAGCDWRLHRMDAQARCEPDRATALLPGGSCNLRPPDGIVAWRAAPATEAAPPAPDRALIERGRDRFERFCAVCHGMLGDGRSTVAANMTLRPPPSLHDPRLVAVPDDRLYRVIGEGYGVMPAYAAALPPRDRWAVIGWVRVLQRSQDVPIDDLPPALREEALPWLR